MIFNMMIENLVSYIFGSYFIFSIFILFMFIVSLLAARVNFLIGLVIAVPLFGGLIVSGWLGGYGWIKPLLTMLMAIIWGFVLWRLIE